MPQSLNHAIIFLISTLFDLYLFVLSVRFILAWSRADYFNPIVRVIIQLTQPIINPLRRLIPNIGRFECATLIFIIFLEIVKITILSFFLMGGAPLAAIILTALEGFLHLMLNTFFYSILLHVIFSWINPGYTPIAQVLAQLSAPILRPCQRLVPPIGGLDLSPVLAMVILQFLLILL